jgi:NADPH-dependent 2,4-dienoyl-CoA reductase/sulfur reductase-like enzyme
MNSPRLLIIGGGGAGLAAVIAACEAGATPDDLLLVERQPYLGGILTQCLHAGFGVREHQGELNGVEFLRPLLRDFAGARVPHLLSTSVLQVKPDRTVILAGPDGVVQLQPEAIILATGCRERPIGSLPVAGTRPSGIFAAGAAQKMVNVNGWDVGNRFVVLGSGDVGLIMAGRFASLGKEVVAVIEQADSCGGLHRNKLRYLDDYGTPLITQSTITEVYGEPRVTGVLVESRKDNGAVEQFELACDTLITSVGLIPEVDIARAVLVGNKQHKLAKSGEQEHMERIDCDDSICEAYSWLHIAGNARKVQSFIEHVTDDGRAAGFAAARQIAKQV